MLSVKKKGLCVMEFIEVELDFNPQIQMRRIRILKKILGLEDSDIDVSEFELQNIIENIF
jgi:hypothetical protein